jgi:TP901 family phage tail tape measure protein
MAAGTTVARINTIVTANTTQFTAAMNKAQTRAGKFAAAAGAAAKAASGPLTMALIGVGGAAIKAATDFDDSMTKIESLVGIAGDEVDAMAESVKALSGETAQAPAKLADAMFFIQSAGLRGATAMETLEASAKASAVGLGDVTEIADLATSALNAYGEENLSAVQATDVLTAAVREGKLEASELAGSMGRVLPIASAMGVRFDEVGAAFAALSRTGTNAAEAATQVRGILSSLLRPTQQAEEALTGMGLSSEGLRQQIKDEGLLATLQTLAEEFDGNAAASASVFGNVRALSGVMDLMGANVETTEAIFANMRDTTGTLDEAFSVVSDTAGFKFRQALADIQEALVSIGQTVLPVVMTMLEGARSMVEAFKAMPTPLKLAAAAMAAFVVASGPIGQIALAVGGLLYAFGKMGEESRRAKDRQAALTEEFKAANDPAATMIDRMTELAASIEDVGDEADDATRPVNNLVGSNLALGMAMDNEVLPLFDDLGISMDDIAAAAENGSDEFQNMEKRFHTTANRGTELRRNFDQLSEAERKVAEQLVAAYEAGDLTHAQFDAMLDVVDETADAFDDNRKELEKQSEEFIKSADAVKLLNDANLDGEKILADWTRAGVSYVDMARSIDYITSGAADAANQYNIEAKRAGITTGDLADELEDAEDPTLDIAEALDEATEAAESLEQQFRDLMGTILSEGQALAEAEMLALDFKEIVEDMGDKSLPELQLQFGQMAEDAAAAIGRIVDAGGDLDGPEVNAAFTSFVESIGAIAAAGDVAVSEIGAAIDALERMSGIEIPIDLRLNLFAQAYGITTAQFANQLGSIDFGAAFGAEGGIVTRPTRAIIGEAGPEAVVPLDRTPGSSPLPAGFGGGGDTHITINMPSGSNGDDVVRALQDYVRRRGSIPVPVGSARY